MRALSVDAQDEGICRLFPAFRQTCALDFVGAWRGPLRPLARTYEIGVVYYPRRRFGGGFLDNFRIRVEVLAPVIGLDPRGTGERPPHIYRDLGPTHGWSLCLYDPRTSQWEPDRLIAETIIPWASEWLFYFEGWLIDGHWAGGGEHPTIPRRSECPTPDPSFPAPPAASLRAAFLRVGRLTGTFASSLSMAAASAEFSRLPSLPTWREVSAADPWSSISISSAAPRPVASSLSDSAPENPPSRSAISTCTAALRSFRPFGTTSWDAPGRHSATTC